MPKQGSYPTLDEEEKKKAWDYCGVRLEMLNTQARSTLDKVHKFLFLANGGGAAATLAFLGAIKSAPNTFKVSVVFFAIGLFVYGLYLAWQYQLFRGLQVNYANDMNKFGKGDLSLDDVYNGDFERGSKVKWGYILAYSSFGLFFIGLIFGILGVL